MELPVYQPCNEERSIQLRRYRDALAISGAAVIAFSVWDIIKLFIGIFLGEQTIAQIIADAMDDFEPTDTFDEWSTRLILWIVLLGIVILMCAVILLYHLYIGVNAYRVGRQTAKNTKKLYLVLTVFSILSSAWIFFPNLISFFMTEDETDQVELGTLLLEVTSLFNYLYLLFAAYRINRLEKEVSQ